MSMTDLANRRPRLLPGFLFLLGWALIAVAAAEVVWAIVWLLRHLGDVGGVGASIRWPRVFTFGTIAFAVAYALDGAQDDGEQKSRFALSVFAGRSSAWACAAMVGVMLAGTIVLWFL